MDLIYSGLGPLSSPNLDPKPNAQSVVFPRCLLSVITASPCNESGRVRHSVSPSSGRRRRWVRMLALLVWSLPNASKQDGPRPFGVCVPVPVLKLRHLSVQRACCCIHLQLHPAFTPSSDHHRRNFTYIRFLIHLNSCFKTANIGTRGVSESPIHRIWSLNHS